VAKAEKGLLRRDGVRACRDGAESLCRRDAFSERLSATDKVGRRAGGYGHEDGSEKAWKKRRDQGCVGGRVDDLESESEGGGGGGQRSGSSESHGRGGLPGAAGGRGVELRAGREKSEPEDGVYILD
jgi:hypothetical protein